MGLYDRDYTRSDFGSAGHNVPQLRFSLPKLTPAVKWLLVINVIIFFIKAFFPNNVIVELPGVRPIYLSKIELWFSVFPYKLSNILQFWRLVTYQFLHHDIFHIMFNMLGLYFLGPTLERHWGSKKFLVFYLCCGAAGGLFFTLLTNIGFLTPGPMIGASGSILGLLAACAILFPQFIVIMVLFPVPIRVATIILTVMYIFFVVTRADNAGGHAAHLAGMAAGAGYVLSQTWRTRMKLKIQSKLWEKKLESQKNLQQQLDEILQKVHDHGIHSLTRQEKRILKKATETERKKRA